MNDAQNSENPVIDPEQQSLFAEGQENAPPKDGQAAPQKSNAQPQPIDLTRFKWNYKGREFVPRDEDHIRRLLSRGYGYDQEIEQLKAQREELEKLKQGVGKYQHLYDAFEQNPQFVQKATSWLAQGGEPGDGEDPSPEARRIMELENRLKDNNSRIETWEQKQADIELGKEIESLKKNHSDNDWATDDGSGTLEKRILKHSLDNKFPTLEAAYRDFMWDSVTTNAKAQGLKDAAAKRQQEKKQGIVSKGGQELPPEKEGEGWKPGLGYDNLAERAAADYKKVLSGG